MPSISAGTTLIQGIGRALGGVGVGPWGGLGVGCIHRFFSPSFAPLHLGGLNFWEDLSSQQLMYKSHQRL